MNAASKAPPQAAPSAPAQAAPSPAPASALSSAISSQELDKRLGQLAPENKYIVNCLASNFTITQIAQALGVTPSAIDQAIEAHELKHLAQLAMFHRNSKITNIDNMLDNIEHKALQNLEKACNYLQDPMKLMRIADFANKAKRRSIPSQGGSSDNIAVAIVQLPARVLESKFIFDRNNQAVEIDGRALVSMPSTQLLAEVRTRKAQENKDELRTIEAEEAAASGGALEAPRTGGTPSVAELL